MADSSTSKILSSLNMKTSPSKLSRLQVEAADPVLSPEVNVPEMAPSSDFEKLLANILGPDYAKNNTPVE